MIKRFILLFLFCLSISFTVKSQYSFEIVLAIEGESLNIADNFIEDSNGNFIGNYIQIKYTDTSTIWNNYILKISPMGDTSTYLFHKKEDTTVIFNKFFQVNKEPVQYIAAAQCIPKAENELYDDMFVLLDNNFNIIWEKQYSLSEYKGGVSTGDMLRLDDGSFLYARQPDWFVDYMYLFHLSADGDSLEYKTFKGDSAGVIMALTYSPDTLSYWLHTYYANYDPTKPAAQVVVLNKQLEYSKLMYYPRWFYEDYYAKVLPGKKLIASGNYNDFDNNYLASFIVDTGLNVLHEDYITDPDTPFMATRQCVDYFYPDQIYTGGTHNRSLYGKFPTWFVLAKYNNELDLIYERYIGDSANYWLFNLTATSDSGVLLSGTRYDYWEPVARKKAIIMKLNPEGIIVGNEEIQKGLTIKKAIIYPNPGGNALYLRTALHNATFVMFDMQGKPVIRQKIEQLISRFNMSRLPAGIYNWTLNDGKQMLESGKWVKQK